MKVQHSLMMFQESLRSKESIKTYTWTIDQFIKYHNLKKKNYDSIVAIEKKELQSMVETCNSPETHYWSQFNFNLRQIIIRLKSYLILSRCSSRNPFASSKYNSFPSRTCQPILACSFFVHDLTNLLR